MLHYLSGSQLLQENVAKFYVCEIILAMENLHKKKILYRDLKPENIVFDNDGHICLIDFGLAKKGITNNLTGTLCGFFLII